MQFLRMEGNGGERQNAVEKNNYLKLCNYKSCPQKCMFIQKTLVVGICFVFKYLHFMLLSLWAL
jgi:hypothetical protein